MIAVDLRRGYLVLTIVGAAVPTALTLYFVAAHGPHPILFLEQMFASTIATATLLDVRIASVAFWVWLSRAAPAAGMTRWWPFVVANLAIGLSFALPLFLYIRETRQPASVETSRN